MWDKELNRYAYKKMEQSPYMKGDDYIQRFGSRARGIERMDSELDFLREKLGERDDRIEQMDKELQHLECDVADRNMTIRENERLIEDLQEKIADLERRNALLEQRDPPLARKGIRQSI